MVCSPEAFIRNVLLGQTFYRQEFGTEATDIFLPDCFGFPYTLPTLASHCGLIGFSSQKLAWRARPFYPGNKRYPFSLGLWKGVDGSQIMMVHGFGYSDRYEDHDLSHNRRLWQETGESPLGIAYRYYGTGDIGGSPTLSSVRAVEKGLHGDGPVKIVSAASDQLYRDFLPYDKHPELPVFDGELPMDLHGNGCYTSQAAMKLYNRQNELLGDAAERMAVMADWLGTRRYPRQLMTDIWRRVIWHQFHDDVTGTSIPKAYEYSWNDELLSLKQFSGVLTNSMAAVARQLDTQVKGTPLVVYNNESFPVTSVVKADLPEGRSYQVYDPRGRRVKTQLSSNGQLLFEATVPATGMAVYSLSATSRPAPQQSDNSRTLENSIYRLQVDEYGDIVSLYDKRVGKELVAEGRRIRLVVLNDCTSEAWPAWEIHKRTLDKEPLPIHQDVKVQRVEQGAVRQTLRITKRYGDTDICQYLHLYEGALADQIDIENVVDWRAENALLKAEFPLSVSNRMATYDLGLGSIQRSTNTDTSYEVCSHEWTDLTDVSGTYGVTILNDSRYGWDKPADNTLRLSLLYAPKPGGGYTYQAHQDKGHHVFTYSLIGHAGALPMAKTVRQSTMLNSPLRAFTVAKHKGALGREWSFLQSDNEHVVVRTMKHAEVSDEYVVRVHEVGGKTTQHARLTFPAAIVQAVEADGTERTLSAASFDGRQLQVAIQPNSVKTYKVKLVSSQPLPAEGKYQTLPLAYNRKCATFNAFRSEADFESGYSYAAELFPDSLTAGGVPFVFGERETFNGLSCQGDTLSLPAGASHLFLLVASNQGDRRATFLAGTSRQEVDVPFYSGFVGQWGHEGQTTGYLKKADVAYVGTHRHSAADDMPYEFTYMYKVRIDLPKGCRQVVLPADEHVVVFAATLFSGTLFEATPISSLFQTSNVADKR
jgi:alpha-mannosidase